MKVVEPLGVEPLMKAASEGRTIVIPTIQTDRLTLEAPYESDFAGYASIVTSDRGQWVGGPLSIEEAWLDFSQMVAGWILRGFGALSVRPAGSDEYLGTVLVHHELGDPEPELGWLFVTEAEGRGFALEAGTAMLEWAFLHTELHTLVSYIDPNNHRAIALAKKLNGYPVAGPSGILTYRYKGPRQGA